MGESGKYKKFLIFYKAANMTWVMSALFASVELCCTDASVRLLAYAELKVGCGCG